MQPAKTYLGTGPSAAEMDARKILLVIFDGLGDRPLTELGHKTPLEATPKPNLDWFASNGVNGLVDPIAPGVAAGSDTSHLALFGYDPHEVYTGRGPFEAAGVGIDLQPGDIAFRGNFACVDEEMKLTDRRAGRIREGTDELAKALDGLKLGRIKATVRAGTEHRVAVVLRGRGLSPRVTDTDPHEIGETIEESKPLESAAKVTAKAVNAFTKQAFKILKSHPVNRARVAKGEPPANAIVLRGAGVFPNLVPITERFHLTAAGIAGVALIRGMFRTIGMDVIDVPGATGGLDTDMIAKADGALDALRSHDLVVLHVKAPDLCGHDGNASEKIRVIERMDAMMGHLKAMLSTDVVVALTADHSTPVALKDHSGDPVPLTIFAGLGFAGILTRDILRQDTGSARMREIAAAIQQGARAFLRRQYKSIAIIAAILAVVFAAAIFGQSAVTGKPDAVELGLKTAGAFALGATFSALSGFIGMQVAIRTNVRSAAGSLRSFNDALVVALRGGAVSGLSIVGLSLAGVSILYYGYGYGVPANQTSQYNLIVSIVGFGFGASLVALFAQLGGGIFTKAADVGADLVGKVEAGIPEDDPRNPAVIADLVGDNVGDCAGRGADLFESTAAENIGAMVLGVVLFPFFGIAGVIFPLLARSFV